MGDAMKCLFCNDPAVAIYHLDEGCYCHPDIQKQALCLQHIKQAHPLGNMVLIEDLTVDKVFEKGLRV